MLKKKEFIDFILEGKTSSTHVEKSSGQKGAAGSDLMDFGFDVPDTEETQSKSETSFAQRLLEASAFGKPDYVQTSDLIRRTDSVARHLPRRSAYWPKTPSRPYQTLLFEADLNHYDLLAIPAFKGRKVRHLDMVEDALARMVSEALDGFQRGGEGVTADVRKGRKEETLCIVSIRDERETEPVRLVSFGTVNAESGGLETFHLTERTRFWDPQLAKEHLGLLYERQFKKLGSAKWQEAFTTTEERKQAKKLLEVCSKPSPQKKEVEVNVITLLDTIAKGFGLRCKPGQKRRLQAFELPTDHDIGIDPEEMVQKHGGKNPFGGVTLRDEKSRLLGYIVYPLKKKEDAVQLRSYLERNNRFHNVLVVFPDGEETTLELWQGKEQLTGKLRKGQGFKDAAEVVSLLSRFFVVSKAKVRNPKELAEELAYRARYLRKLALRELKAEKDDGPLRSLYKNFRQTLIHDQKEGEFADAFAQTLTYSLLTARWIGNDLLAENGERFTRQNAAKYLPATGNFLKELFKKVLSVKMDEQRGRLLWLVDDIADLLDRVDVTYVFGIGDQNSDKATDPVIHFYEPFLAAYDSELRSKRGVYYTPQPVVSYIVRSVHELLQKEFGLADGLADITTWGEMLEKHPDLKLPPLTDEPGDKRTISPDEPFVQILDPATGTATFLVEVIEVIHRTLVEKWQQKGLTESQQSKAWNDYVPQYLLPRLYGFELMMAPYAVAHMKIGLKLAETGYRFGAGDRARVYLTNALEPWVKQLPLIGFNALAQEAADVNGIKRAKRFTVVIGNPPYSVKSFNRGESISAAIEVYKLGLGEKKLNLDDDFIKFIRYAEKHAQLVEAAVVGMITNNIFLSGVTHRGMRNHLLQTFDELIFVNLRGDSRYHETAPEGLSNDNVFDIQQGVAISFLSRIPAKKQTVKYADIWGKRIEKHNTLNNETLSSLTLQDLLPEPDLFQFIPITRLSDSSYFCWPSLDHLFPIYTNGIETHKDAITIHFSKDHLKEVVNDMLTLKEEEVRAKHQIGKDGTYWSIAGASASLKRLNESKREGNVILYRPFDQRYTVIHPGSCGFLARPRWDVMSHMLLPNNLGLLTARLMVRGGDWDSCFVTRFPTEKKAGDSTRSSTLFPLYLVSNPNIVSKQSNSAKFEPTANLNPDIINTFATSLKLSFSTARSLSNDVCFTPEDFFHYVYSILSSKSYRKIFKEQLAVAFPRIPFCANKKLFKFLCQIGADLVSLHLFEQNYVGASMKPKTSLEKTLSGIECQGLPEILKSYPKFKSSKIFINKSCCFTNVSEEVWNFSIGGYQVCHKWLKDRRGRTLSTEEIKYYQKIITAISETIRLQTEIDKVIDEHGGWPGAFVTDKGGAT